MDIGIKYCGGCNPRYDRKRFAELLKRRFGHSFETADAENEYDVLVVLCGCSSSCAGFSQYKVKSGQVVIVRSEADFDDAVNSIIKRG